MHAAPTGLPVADAPAAPQTPRIVLQAHPDMPLLAFPQGVALEVLAEPVAIRIPNTRRWFDGAVGLRGNLLPILDLAGWAGYRTVPGKRRLVAVSSRKTPFVLVTGDIPQLLVIAAEGVQHIEAPVAPSTDALAPYLGATHATAIGTVHEFHMQAWVAEVRRELAGGASG